MPRPLLLILLLSIPLTSCDIGPDLTDADHDGYSVEQGDCDDNDPTIHPGAVDYPGTGIGGGNNIDEDCDGTGAVLCYIDADNDGFGNSLQQTRADPAGDCDAAVGLADNPFDCADNEARVNPDEIEVCDGLDNDCVGGADNDLDPSAWDSGYIDSDGDGDGAGESIQVCAGSAALVDSNSDCDDSNPQVYAQDHSGAAADEICDGVDNNCDGLTLPGEAEQTDNDGDGFFTCRWGEQGECDESNPETWDALHCGDCNDSDPTVHPYSYEICGDNLNNDCDGETDETEDGDGDGYDTCDDDGEELDCNDGDAQISPGAAEIACDGIDNDCNGIVDADGARIMIVGHDPAMTAQLASLIGSDSPGPQYCTSVIDGRGSLPPNVDLSDYKLLILAPEMADSDWEWAGPPPPNAFTALMERRYRGETVPSMLGMGYAGKALFEELGGFGDYDWPGLVPTDPPLELSVHLPIGEMAVQCASGPANCLDNAANPPGRLLGNAASNGCSPLGEIQRGDDSSTPLFSHAPNLIELDNNFMPVVAATPSSGRVFPIWAGIDSALPTSVRYVGRPGCDQDTVDCWPSCSDNRRRALLAHHGIEILSSGGAPSGVMADLDIGETLLHHWGWDAPPSAWTDDAQALFKNLVYLAVDCPQGNPTCNPNMTDGAALQ